MVQASLTAAPIGRPVVLADMLGGTRARDAALVAGGVLLTALLAQVSLPVPGSPVPITGHTLAVVLVAAGLGPARGVAAQVAYIGAALIGFPFYAEATGGYQVVFSASGGYVFGFVPAAYLIGLAARHGADRNTLRALPLFLLGQAVIFAVGIPWLAVTAGLNAEQALEAGLYPFILGGVVKAAVAAVLLPAAWRTVRHYTDGESPAGRPVSPAERPTTREKP